MRNTIPIRMFHRFQSRDGLSWPGHTTLPDRLVGFVLGGHSGTLAHASDLRRGAALGDARFRFSPLGKSGSQRTKEGRKR